jgi:hypothetical protein
VAAAIAVGGIIGLLLGVAALGGGLLSGWRLAYVPGVLVGIGVTWLALLARVAGACSGVQGPDCVMPDLGPWVLVLGALALVGIGLTLIGVRRMGSQR